MIDPTPSPRKGPNGTMIALAGGLLILVLLFAYFATNRNADQDKLTGANASSAAADEPEKLCASKSTYDLIKRELFRRAGAASRQRSGRVRQARRFRRRPDGKSGDGKPG